MYRIISKCLRILIVLLALLVFLPKILQAQDVASLKEAIITHYKFINAGENIGEHHRSDFTIFFNDGSMLVTTEDVEVANQVGFSSGEDDEESERNTNLVPYNFTAQIYDNVGLATFYLWGSYGSGEEEEEGMWRVSAVWIYEKGDWREAHHHESPLIVE